MRGDLISETGEISLDLCLNSKTGEKSPDRGVHAAMLAGMPRLASNAFRDTPITRAIALTGICSARCSLRISAQSSTESTPFTPWLG